MPDFDMFVCSIVFSCNTYLKGYFYTCEHVELVLENILWGLVSWQILICLFYRIVLFFPAMFCAPFPPLTGGMLLGARETRSWPRDCQQPCALLKQGFVSCVAVCCSVLQCFAVCCSVAAEGAVCPFKRVSCVAVCCSAVQWCSRMSF